jgi:hypothetical protein
MTTKKLNRTLVAEQVKLMNEVLSDAEVNIVNCGMCSSVLLHKTNAEQITCPHCEYTSEPCDFPDFIYDGILNNICE